MMRAEQDQKEKAQAEQTQKEKAQAEQAKARWKWFAVATGALFWDLVVCGMLSQALKERNQGLATTLVVLMLLAVLLLLWRVWLVFPREAEGILYSDWRKAMQKPMEYTASVVVLFVVVFIWGLSGSAPADLDSIRIALLTLVSWAQIPGLVGACGADIAAWQDKQWPSGRPRFPKKKRGWLLFVSLSLAFGVGGFMAGWLGERDPEPPAVRCTSLAAPLAPGATGATVYGCAPEAEWTPAADPTAKTLEFPTYSCSAPPATRDAAGNFPSDPPTYSCTGR